MAITRYDIEAVDFEGDEPILIDAGCDWLSMTAAHGEDGEAVRSLAHRICASEIERGMEGERAPMSRYTGFKAGSCSFGERPEDVMLQLSGALAKAHSKEAVALARTVSRVDVQVTVATPSADNQVALRAYKRAERGTGKKGRPTRAKMVVSTSGGKTLYLGADSSDRVVKVYDKGIEQGSAPRGRIWRCEAVLKRKFAMPAARFITENGAGESGSEAVVRKELQRKSGQPFWSPTEAQYAVATGSLEPATVARKLNWLEEQIRPSVAWLVMRGHRADVLRVLGLSESSETYLDDSTQP
jgi:hypothetical protein